MFLFFISSYCPQLFYCSPALSASLNTHVVSTNFAKTLVANVKMTSYYDATNSVYPVTMTTIHQCSMLGFGRGHPIKQSPQASPDLCTSLESIHLNLSISSSSREKVTKGGSDCLCLLSPGGFRIEKSVKNCVGERVPCN